MVRLVMMLVWCAAVVAAGDPMDINFMGSAPRTGSASKKYSRSVDVGDGLSCNGESCEERLRSNIDALGRSSHSNNLKISVIRRGKENTKSFRIYFKNPSGPISPFHDIPLYADKKNGILNMVVEVPRWQNAKLEISRELKLNPIVQNVRDGDLYYVSNPFPYNGYSWNYGSLPQTWVDPNEPDKVTGKPGDNNPVDVIEMGQRIAQPGDIIQIKVLGIFALIDEDKTNWKVLAVNKDDINAPRLNDLNDVRTNFRGVIGRTADWFKVYKIPLGVPENTIEFKDQPQNRSFALEIIKQAHDNWEELITGWAGPNGISIASVTLPTAKERLTPAQAQKIVDASAKPGPAAPVDESVNEMQYLVGTDPE